MQPLHVFYYRGAWRFACRMSRADLPPWSDLPCTVGSAQRTGQDPRMAGEVADSARDHFRSEHMK